MCAFFKITFWKPEEMLEVVKPINERHPKSKTSSPVTVSIHLFLQSFGSCFMTAPFFCLHSCKKNIDILSDIDEIFAAIPNRCYSEIRLHEDCNKIFESWERPENIIETAFDILGQMIDQMTSLHGNMIYELNGAYLIIIYLKWVAYALY